MECACQPVPFLVSGSGRPWPGLLSLRDLLFLAALRLPLAGEASGSGLLVFSESIVFVLILFLFCPNVFAVVTFITRVWGKPPAKF
jgi:hypothetical protein